MVGKILKNRYELIAQLGKGGMSVVYLARDKILGSYWAVKCVKKKTDVDINAFKKEVELLSSLNHADIPRIVDRIEEYDYYFVVMDFVDGVALSKRIKTEGPISEQAAVHYMILLCDILDYLHNAKDNPIVYRDVKPENLMLTPADRIKLIDFGIAKECIRGKKDTGPKVGTKGYAAPEQYAGGALDERTDIYSLGVTVFSLVTGKAPSKPVKRGQIIRIPLIRDVNPNLSEGLEYIVEKCTQINPEDRYQNCQELKFDLENIERLNSSYKKSMLSKLLAFSSSLLLCLLSVVFIFVGKNGIELEKTDSYDKAYRQAYSYEIQGDYPSAITMYTEAVEYKPDKEEAYVRWFNVMVKQAGEDPAAIKEAIDQAKTRYIDNPQSKMYRNVRLMYVVAKTCMNVTDVPVYCQYAYEYFTAIQDSSEYEKGVFSQTEIQSLALIAGSFGTDSINKDFQKLQEAMNALENETRSGERMTVSDQIDNYYNLVFLYNFYEKTLGDSYERADNIGGAVKELIRNNQIDDQIDTLNDSAIKIYQLLAKNQLSGARNHQNTQDEAEAKLKLYESAVDWFSELDSLRVKLTPELKLKKAEAYKGCYDVKKRYFQVDEKAREYMNSAIALNRELLELPENSDNQKEVYTNKFSAALYLVDLYINQSDLTNAQAMLNTAYNYLQQLDNSSNLTSRYETASTNLMIAQNSSQ